MVIVIDFDGTCVTHEFPAVGKSIGAEEVLRDLVKAGHRLVLFTMRSDVENPVSDDPNILPEGGTYLSDALVWFRERDIPLWGVQKNPEQGSWTHSPKAYGQLYIDDAGLGCPLLYPVTTGEERPFVDWVSVRELLEIQGIL